MILKAGNFMLALTASYSFEQKRANNGAKAPRKGSMEEWTHMSHFEFLVGTNTAKIRAAYFKLAKISCWVIRAKGTPILTKRQPSPQKRNKLGRMNKHTCCLFKFLKLATCLIHDFLISDPLLCLWLYGMCK